MGNQSLSIQLQYEGNPIKSLDKLHEPSGYYLLILDDFGLQPFDAQSRASLLDIIEDRHQKRSTVVTSQIPVKEWYDIIGEKTIADAILDRIVHHSLRVELYGESLRRRNSKSENVFL
jgi:DNA replication protein DnaC